MWEGGLHLFSFIGDTVNVVELGFANLAKQVIVLQRWRRKINQPYRGQSNKQKEKEGERSRCNFLFVLINMFVEATLLMHAENKQDVPSLPTSVLNQQQSVPINIYNNNDNSVMNKTTNGQNKTVVYLISAGSRYKPALH